jgi:hypothetical protein
MAEDCKQVQFKFQSRIDNGVGLDLDGVDLSIFDDPENAVPKKIVFQNTPILKEAHGATFTGDGDNNLINLGNTSVSGLEARVKRINKEPVAILSVHFAGLTATEELVSWLHHNVGKIVEVSLEKLQQEMPFDKKESTKKGRSEKAA